MFKVFRVPQLYPIALFVIAPLLEAQYPGPAENGLPAYIPVGVGYPNSPGTPNGPTTPNPPIFPDAFPNDPNFPDQPDQDRSIAIFDQQAASSSGPYQSRTGGYEREQIGAVSVAELQHPLSRKARSLLLKAERALQQSKPAECLRILQEASKEQSAGLYIPGTRGAALMLQGHLTDAITALEEAVKIMPISANFSNLGLAYSLSGEQDQAVQELRRALQLGDSPRTRFLMGLLLLDKKSAIEEACDDLEDGRNVAPSATLALAVCYARDGRPSAADALVQSYLASQHESDAGYWEQWVASVASETHPAAKFGVRYNNDTE